MLRFSKKKSQKRPTLPLLYFWITEYISFLSVRSENFSINTKLYLTSVSYEIKYHHLLNIANQMLLFHGNWAILLPRTFLFTHLYDLPAVSHFSFHYRIRTLFINKRNWQVYSGKISIRNVRNECISDSIVFIVLPFHITQWIFQYLI